MSVVVVVVVVEIHGNGREASVRSFIFFFRGKQREVRAGFSGPPPLAT